MSMLPPTSENSYQDYVKAIRNAVQTVVEECMSKASEEVTAFYETESHGLYNIAISGYGT